jgi:hypothetical protein
VRLLAGVWCALALAAAGQQPIQLPERIVVSRTQAVVSFDTLVGEVARADVLLVSHQADAPVAHRFEITLVDAVARRRPQLVVALDVVDRAAQDPLEHYQMEHLSDAEFTREARLSPIRAALSLPLMKLARARHWPIVAIGPAATDDGGPMRAAIAQAASTAAADAKRPLVVSVHTGRLAASDIESMRRDLAGRQVVVLAIAPAANAGLPGSPGPVGSDYVAYAR